MQLCQEGERIEFYLDNGERFDYLLYPGKSLVEHIMNMVALYASLTFAPLHDDIYVRPEVMFKLNRDIRTNRFSSGPEPLGATVVRITTMVGTVTIKPMAGMRWSVFVGTLNEYKQNDWNELLEKALST